MDAKSVLHDELKGWKRYQKLCKEGLNDKNHYEYYEKEYIMSTRIIGILEYIDENSK